jgi:hypothetical protein
VRRLAAVGRLGYDRFDPVGLFSAAAHAFRNRAAGAASRDRPPGQPFVLLADDLPLLDPTSLMLLGQLVAADAIFLIGTVRTEEPVPPAVSALWRAGELARIDLDELSVAGVEEVLAAVLGGPVEAGTVADVYAVGRGNLLYVRELVLGALAAGRRSAGAPRDRPPECTPGAGTSPPGAPGPGRPVSSRRPVWCR